MFLRLALIAGLAAGLAACGNTGAALKASVAPGAVTVNLPMPPQPAVGSKAAVAVSWFCQADNVLHPIADGVLGMLGVPVAGPVNDAVVHPLIEKYCAGKGATATAVVTGPAAK